VRAKDKDEGVSAEKTATVAVTNALPVILGSTNEVGGITGLPSAPIPAGTSVTLGVQFTDAGTADTHTGTITWDIGLAPTTVATVSPVGTTAGTVTATRSLPAGIYTVTMTVTDDDGGSAKTSEPAYIVVYDPNGGFVTGGGWVDSPAGALVSNPSAVGRANFGFTSKYQRGANIPTGHTEFQFQAGSLDFKSTSYQWLVVAGARAQYKGVGTIKGQTGEFQFLLTAVDAAINGGGSVDKFRIKITSADGTTVVYDNGLGAGDDSDTGSALRGGNISIKP
jgi:hypothetical protein